MFGVRLKQLREERGLTQKQLAEKAGVSLRAVTHWEQNLREPSWSNVQALAKVLGVDCRAFQADPSEPPRPAAPTPRGRPRKSKLPAPGLAFHQQGGDEGRRGEPPSAEDSAASKPAKKTKK